MPRMKDELTISAESVRRYRKQLGLSQQDLAIALGLGVDCIRKWEQDTSRCSGPAAILLKRMVADSKAELVSR